MSDSCFIKHTKSRRKRKNKCVPLSCNSRVSSQTSSCTNSQTDDDLHKILLMIKYLNKKIKCIESKQVCTSSESKQVCTSSESKQVCTSSESKQVCTSSESKTCTSSESKTCTNISTCASTCDSTSPTYCACKNSKTNSCSSPLTYPPTCETEQCVTSISPPPKCNHSSTTCPSPNSPCHNTSCTSCTSCTSDIKCKILGTDKELEEYINYKVDCHLEDVKESLEDKIKDLHKCIEDLKRVVF